MDYKMQVGRVSSPSVSSAGGGDEDQGVGHALSDFLLQLEGYNPTIPESVVSYYLNMSGFESQDPRLIRLIAIAAQKFLSDVANDALQHCKTRSTNNAANTLNKNAKNNSKDRKYTMTMEDLTPALSDIGINAKKPHYFV